GLLEHYLALDARTGHDAPLTATRALHGGAQPPQSPTPQPATAQAPGPQAPGPHAPLAPDAEGAASSGLTITEELQAALAPPHAVPPRSLTAKAGTAKSTLIRHYLEPPAPRTLTAAPTGIAALNVDGYTIHRLFSFPPGGTEETGRSGRCYPWRWSKALK